MKTGEWLERGASCLLCSCALAACGGSAVSEPQEDGDSVGTTAQALASVSIQHVFVIAMENRDSSQVYGNTTSAPYLNGTLVTTYARSTNFNDPLSLSTPSEPHYIWMEAGTNAFSDRTFTSNSDPSSRNSTASTAHLVTQIKNATSGVTWRSYQEGMNSATGDCPVRSSGFYAAKHNPFVFFRDVAGNPPSTTNAYCAAHHRPYSALAADLAAGDVASYTFITPDLCHDMHGASGCSGSDPVRAADNWLAAEMPRLIAYAEANRGVVFLTWDEGGSTLKMPFPAIGPGVKTGYAGSVSYTHSSLLKSVEEILGLPILAKVASANNLSDLFQEGHYP